MLDFWDRLELTLIRQVTHLDYPCTLIIYVKAAYEIFKDAAIYYAKTTIPDTLESLDNLDYAVVPRENSIFGPVIETFDWLRSFEKGSIQGEIVLKIQHCLVVRKGMHLEDIECIMSHEQALGQCRKFIAKNLPNSAISKTTSTAAAAETVSRSTTLNVAAICSKVCVTMFEGLDLIKEGIQDEDSNYTRFFLVGKDSQHKLPTYPVHPTHALIRVTPTSLEMPVNLLALLKTIDVPIIRIDRRPSLSSLPFSDTYFLELNTSSDSPSWSQQVERTLWKIRDIGFSAEKIGTW
ncbi:hypothetical protein D9757_002839 [Collybiopsis confluens]|uniref:prephenate dehydratase n=1 Tax=Collybiopsis confluens TaxID=2823264 RepID=A0A8H5MDC7_9AGAR|nr:hypothetical protein D9757_002839 [Collybiopsis confluens]